MCIASCEVRKQARINDFHNTEFLYREYFSKPIENLSLQFVILYCQKFRYESTLILVTTSFSEGIIFSMLLEGLPVEFYKEYSDVLI